MTDIRPYPDHVDWGWLACDREGQLALFVTGGQGPVPAQALSPGSLEDATAAIGVLPKMSDARLLVSYPSARRFIDAAECGIFAYDWSDAHRNAAEAIDAYELIAMPYRPRMLDQLAIELSPATRLVRFTALSFADSWRVDVRAHMICREARRR